MFEFYGFLIRVVRAEVGLTVMLFEDADDTDPLTFHTKSRDPYCAAGGGSLLSELAAGRTLISPMPPPT